MGATEDFSRHLLERDRELAELDRALASAAHGRGSVVTVTGPAGIGKTSLLRCVPRVAAGHGLKASFGRGSELEVSFSYGVVKQLFEPIVHALGAKERAAAFAGAAAVADAVIGGGVLEGPRRVGRDRAFAVVYGLYWLVINLSQGWPLAIVVDDLHWADSASLRFLAYLAARVGELPVALVCAARPLEGSGPAELVGAVTEAEAALALTPSPLSSAAVARLVEELSGDRPAPAFAEACHIATGGNPFLCTALVTALVDEGVATGPEDAPRALVVATRAVATVVVRRLGRLSPAASVFAQAVAVLGGGIELRHAAALAGLELDQAAAVADALADQGILRPGRPVEFAHPLVSACVYDRIPAARLALLHAQAARVLRDQGATEARVAAHLLASEPAGEEWAVDSLFEAADRASTEGDPSSAVAYLTRALQEPPAPRRRPVALHRLGMARLQAGDPAGAAPDLRRAFTESPDQRAAAEAGHDLALALTTAGNYAEAVAVLETCATAMADIDPDRSLGLEAELHQSALMDPGQYRRVSRRVARLAADREGSTPGERALLAALATEACLRTQPASTVRGLASRTFERGLLADHVTYASLWGNAVFPLLFAEGYDQATIAIDQAAADARERGSPVGLARAYAARSLLQFRQGFVRDAEVDARASVDLGMSGGYLISLIPLGVLVEALTERGDTDAADAALEAAERTGALGPGFLESWVLHGRGWLRLAQGRTREAADDFAELGRRGEEGWHPWNPGMFAYRSGLALARWQLGDESGAGALAADEVERARRWGGRRAIGIALRTAGQVARGQVRLNSLAASVEVLDGSGAGLEHARSIVALGAALRREGRRSDASAILHDGMDLAHRYGGLAVAAAARDELVTLGERPRRAARHGLDALTASELRVARMAATGAANRDIAQALFVTVRTVEVHLTSTYRKLGISARDELGEALR